MAKVVIRINIDDEKLNAYADSLYGGSPDDPPPENNGKILLNDWVEDFKEQLNSEGYLDTVWFDSQNSYINSATVEIEDSLPERIENPLPEELEVLLRNPEIVVEQDWELHRLVRKYLQQHPEIETVKRFSYLNLWAIIDTDGNEKK